MYLLGIYSGMYILAYDDTRLGWSDMMILLVLRELCYSLGYHTSWVRHIWVGDVLGHTQVICMY